MNYLLSLSFFKVQSALLLVKLVDLFLVVGELLHASISLKVYKRRLERRHQHIYLVDTARRSGTSNIKTAKIRNKQY